MKIMYEFPHTMGKVAPMSLKARGINNLHEVTKYTEKELLAIHGVGPKAIRIIKETLAASKMSLKQN